MPKTQWRRDRALDVDKNRETENAIELACVDVEVDFVVFAAGVVDVVVVAVVVIVVVAVVDVAILCLFVRFFLMKVQASLKVY